MLNIDTLKDTYYNNIAQFVIKLCEGTNIKYQTYGRDYYKEGKWMYTIILPSHLIIFSFDYIMIPLATYQSLNNILETKYLLNKINPLLKCLI